MSHLLILLCICSVKLNRSINISSRCFWEGHALTTVSIIDVKGREVALLVFWKKLLLVIVFLGQELNCIFHWKTQLLILYKSSSISFRKVPLKEGCIISNYFTNTANTALRYCGFNYLPRRGLNIKSYPLIKLTCMSIFFQKI